MNKYFQIITDQLKDDEVNVKVTNDWKFAAMVIDRMCLIIFTLFTIIATITVLFSAPHIIVTWFEKIKIAAESEKRSRCSVDDKLVLVTGKNPIAIAFVCYACDVRFLVWNECYLKWDCFTIENQYEKICLQSDLDTFIVVEL